MFEHNYNNNYHYKETIDIPIIYYNCDIFFA